MQQLKMRVHEWVAAILTDYIDSIFSLKDVYKREKKRQNVL